MILDCCTKQCSMPESISSRLAAPSSCTGSSKNKHSAGVGTAPDNLHAYFIAIFGVWMCGVLLFLYIVYFLLCLAQLLLSGARQGLQWEKYQHLNPENNCFSSTDPLPLHLPFSLVFWSQVNCNFSHLVFQCCYPLGYSAAADLIVQSNKCCIQFCSSLCCALACI